MNQFAVDKNFYHQRISIIRPSGSQEIIGGNDIFFSKFEGSLLNSYHEVNELCSFLPSNDIKGCFFRIKQ